MNWNDIRENWPAYTNSIVARWPELDAETVADIGGDRAVFATYLSKMLGEPKSTADEEINAWLEGPLPLDAAAHPTRDNRTAAESRAHIPPGEDVYSEDAGFGDDGASEPPVGRSR